MMQHSSKELLRSTVSYKSLKDRAYEIAKNPKYDEYQRVLASMVYKFFFLSVNKELPQELHKPLIKKFKSNKAYARFKDNIWAADLTEMGSLSSKKQGIKYLLFVVDVFIKYAWVKPLKDEKGKIVHNGFIETVNESNWKPKKLWVDQRREFYNSPMQK